MYVFTLLTTGVGSCADRIQPSLIWTRAEFPRRTRNRTRAGSLRLGVRRMASTPLYGGGIPNSTIAPIASDETRAVAGPMEEVA